MSETGIAQVFLGGLIAISASYFTHRQQEDSKARAVTAAFMVEIESLLELIRRREYIKAFQDGLKSIQKRGRPYSLEIPVTQPYFDVYLKNTGSIGYLGVHAEGVVRFYHTMFSIVEDLASIVRIQNTLDTDKLEEEVNLLLYQGKFYEEILKQFEQAVAIGSKLLADYKSQS